MKKSKQISFEELAVELKQAQPSHQILHGDVYASLSSLMDNSVDCAVTSPPYWSQRDYGFPNQIGNESTVDEYFLKLTTIYRRLRDKLKPQGVFYHNIGDKYLSKYGHSNLGMLPYRLAYYMIQDGWILIDTIVWYKNNHMPSSVTNRLTNTYEPVFVFAKNKENYYTEYKNQHNVTNIVKIPLQQLKYAHTASYPEKLVEILLSFGIPKRALILDPFAGTGTTCKVVQQLNRARNDASKSIMIEAQVKYVRIILDRCNLSKNSVQRITTLPYETLPIPMKMPPYDKPINDKTFTSTNLCILNLNTTLKFTENIGLLYENTLFNALQDDGLLLLRLPDHDVEKMMLITHASRWIIRNMVIFPIANDWQPIFILVKDVKNIMYKFNLDKIRVAQSTESVMDWTKIDFIGYKVTQNTMYFQQPNDGTIVQIFDKYGDGIPKFVTIQWKNGTYSVMQCINDAESREVTFLCPQCNATLTKHYHPQQKTACDNCGLLLWQNVSSIPKLRCRTINLPALNISAIKKKSRPHTKKEYNGKFKNAERINMGQSPGARSSVSEEYFSVQRFYKLIQPMIAEYLNLHRVKMGLTKTQFTQLFPAHYKYTINHWLRKDMGGSIPNHEDLLQLKQILHLDDEYFDYIDHFGIKLQTVKASAFGKNPGDYMELPYEQIIEKLKKLVET